MNLRRKRNGKYKVGYTKGHLAYFGNDLPSEGDGPDDHKSIILRQLSNLKCLDDKLKEEHATMGYVDLV